MGQPDYWEEGEDGGGRGSVVDKKRARVCVCVRGSKKGFREGKRMCVLGRCAKRGFSVRV